MTYEEVVEAAMARGLDWDADFPSTRLPLYRRIGTRQQQLFTMASKANPDYYGVKAGAAIDANDELNLRDMAGVPAVDQAAGVQRIEIGDHGTSSYADGDEVHTISIDDPDAALAPRVTLRDMVIKGFGTDLDNVTSLCVYYPRYPDMPDNDEDGSTDLEISEAYTELLVIDLTKYLVKKTLSIEADVKARVMEELEKEEQEQFASYMSDVVAFSLGQSRRFSEPPSTTSR
ncbi:MAG: hypothetical protein M8858_08130 [marine benthic group bacterium]|nr:hypothetical protein [Gemmatimonadota bacterium]